MMIRLHVALTVATIAGVFGCGAGKASQPDPAAPTDTAVRLEPQPLTSPETVLRVHIADTVRAEAKTKGSDPAAVCNQSVLADLRRLVSAKYAFDNSSGDEKARTGRQLAALVTLKAPLGKEGALTLEELGAISEAALAKTRELRQKAQADEKLSNAATKTIGGQCDADCVGIVIRVCTDPYADATTRSDVVGPALLPGFSWQSSVVAGLGSFLRERSESEATLWVVSNVQDNLCDEKLSKYFRRTCTLNSYARVGTAPLSGAIAAAAIRSDLEELPLRVLDKHDGEWASLPAIEVLIDLLNGIRRGDAPQTLLASLDTNPTLKAQCKDLSKPTLACDLRKLGGLVSLLGLASQPTRSTDEPDFRLLARQLADGIAKLKANKSLCPQPPTEKSSTICAIGSSLPVEKLEDLLRVSHRLSQKLRQYAEQNMTNEQRLIVGGELLQLTTSAMRTAHTVWLLSLAADEEAKDPSRAEEVKARTRAAAAKWVVVEQAVDATALLLRGRTADGTLRFVDWLSANVPKCESTSGPNCVPPELINHVPLIVDIASAQRPEDVQAALQAAAAPVGSWRVKRNGKMLLSVSAFVGASGGYESPVTGRGRAGTGVAGAVAALGLDWTIAGGNWGEFGVLGTVLDVGQLVTAPIDPIDRHLENGDKSYAEGGAKIELVQVLSPGAYVHYGIARTPLVLGAGYSIAPRLRRYVTEARTETFEDNFTMHRVLVLLAIDVTLFPL